MLRQPNAIQSTDIAVVETDTDQWKVGKGTFANLQWFFKSI
jgi:hypothetical protein